MTVALLLAPGPAPGVSLTGVALNTAAWMGMFVLAPTLIAIIHRCFR